MQPKITKKLLEVQLAQTQKKFRVALVLALIAWLCLPLEAWLFWNHFHTTSLSFKSSPVYTTVLPLRFSPPALVSFGQKVQDLAVTEAHIVDGIWETSEQSATHLSTSARPGEGGNVVIYAHNRRGLFQSLHELKLDDQVTITTAEGTEYLYRVTSKEVVEPDQVEVVYPTYHEELTLYTCTGLFDRYRLVIKAQPIGVSKAQ